jgi:hypothetical protein
MLNASSRKSAEQALRKEVRERFDLWWYRNNPDKERPYTPIREMIPKGCPDISDLLDQLAELHKPIRKFFYTGVATELMYTDSQIAEQVMLTLIDRGVAVLPVHDSFLVRQDREGMLWEAMREAFRQVASVECCIEADPTELDDYRTQPDKYYTSPAQFVAVIDAEDREASKTYWTSRQEWEQGAARSAAPVRNAGTTEPTSNRKPDPSEEDIDQMMERIGLENGAVRYA